jgi:hypothetical protein
MFLRADSEAAIGPRRRCHAPDYRRQARFYDHARSVALFRARNSESGFARLDGVTVDQKQKALDQARRFAVWCSQLKSKYQRAAYLPWLPVGPDPGPP